LGLTQLLEDLVWPFLATAPALERLSHVIIPLRQPRRNLCTSWNIGATGRPPPLPCLRRKLPAQQILRKCNGSILQSYVLPGNISDGSSPLGYWFFQPCRPARHNKTICLLYRKKSRRWRKQGVLAMRYLWHRGLSAKPKGYGGRSRRKWLF